MGFKNQLDLRETKIAARRGQQFLIKTKNLR
jgi:hypothetical protein